MYDQSIKYVSVKSKFSQNVLAVVAAFAGGIFWESKETIVKKKIQTSKK